MYPSNRYNHTSSCYLVLSLRELFALPIEWWLIDCGVSHNSSGLGAQILTPPYFPHKKEKISPTPFWLILILSIYMPVQVLKSELMPQCLMSSEKMENSLIMDIRVTHFGFFFATSKRGGMLHACLRTSERWTLCSTRVKNEETCGLIWQLKWKWVVIQLISST